MENITYVANPGADNTETVIQRVFDRLQKGDITHVVLASTTGSTALKLSDKIKDRSVSIVSATLHAGFSEPGKKRITEEQIRAQEEKGITVFTGSHALSGVNRSITNKFGGTSPLEMVGHTLRLFCGHGLKVGVEVSIMAADAGHIPVDRDIIAIGGTGGGADTAIVLRAAHMNNFFDLKIKEILIKPIDC